MWHGVRVGMEGSDRGKFLSYLGVKKHVRQTVVRSAFTMNFIDFRVNSLIYLFGNYILKSRKSKENE